MPEYRRPKLGQHFLSNPGYRGRIIASLDLRPDDLVVEIGPGGGAMTELLAEPVRRVVAIELDGDLARRLAEKLAAIPAIEIVRADILDIDLAALCRRCGTKQCFVFGNLPYYITSPIIHRLFRFRSSIRAMSLLVQREVAERLIAAPGTRAYGYLSLLAQFDSRPRKVLSVPRGAFSPPPKVDSALVNFQMGSTFRDWGEKDRENFLKFVKRCFSQKRKKLLNNLSKIYSRERVLEELSRLALPAGIRAEQLGLDQFACLFRRLDGQ